ncbi:MAG TPA: isocitrate lyase/PEP mutase family protein [Actinomycetota bacterium]|nr:isocitrate lyase/PEP mutase family protein [Actinomycetota bacterium]
MHGAAQRIRDLLAAGHAINMPGVYDALSARLATQAGFDVLFISGYSVSGSRLALPDFGYLTQTEVTQTAREVCAATPLPVIVDADTGYGNPLSALRTARLVAGAGGGGVFLEDQLWPKKCGHFAGKRVVPASEWLAKLRALLDLRAEEGVDLFLVARTDARSAVSLHEAIDRAKAARDLGVDAVFVEAPESIDELERVAKEVEGVTRVANMIEGGRTPLLTPKELHDLGFDLIVTPLTALFAATRAIREAFAVLKAEGTLRDRPDLVVSFTEFEPVVDLAGHRALEERYGA